MSKKTLLCVDDEVIGLRSRKLFLERHGYAVLTADGGEDGILLFRQHEVDAVVLDYMMPGMTGGSVASVMKSAKPNVPIILLSAYLSLPKKDLANVDAFLVKGDSPNVLLEKLAELTQKVAP